MKQYLATGDRYKSIALTFRIGDRTVSNIVNEVCGAIWTLLQPIYMPEPSVELWKDIASEYENKCFFYNCLGAVGGKRIMTFQKAGLSVPSEKESPYVILIAAVDAHFRFTFIDILTTGRFSDESKFHNTLFGKHLCDISKFPHPKALPDDELLIPYMFVADETIPLINNLMRAYPIKNTEQVLSYDKKVFNCRLNQAQQTVECAFGILSNKFQVFKKPFKCKLGTVETIIMSCCVIHNYLRAKTLSSSEESDEIYVFELPFENENQLLPLKNNDIRISDELYMIREELKDYYNSPKGSVDWQHSEIEDGHF